MIVKQASLVAESHVDRLYREVKAMLVAYRFKPGERINESVLVNHLGGSRTPLREALNRLVAESFLTFQPGRGFFCRALDSKEIHELYQLRAVLEEAAVHLVAARISDQEIAEIEAFLNATGTETTNADELVGMDEHFHTRLMAASGNGEMIRLLENVNARIRFIRWVDMDRRRPETQREHRAILQALKAGDGAGAARRMRVHIERRDDQITQAVREGYSRLYVPGTASEQIGDGS